VSHGWARGRTSSTLGRHSSEIRTGCANERPSGSVRGAPGNWCPYRDHHLIRSWLWSVMTRFLMGRIKRDNLVLVLNRPIIPKNNQ
jgi:hypothetical protein